MIQTYINWEKKQIEWREKKPGASDHGISWISFIKGVLLGLIIFHFLFN